MTYERFLEMVTDGLKKRLGDSVALRADTVRKNNGLLLHALSLHSEDSNIAPCIYLDTYFSEYEQGELTMNDVLEDIMDIYEQRSIKQNMNIGMIADFEQARPYLHARLVNTKMNEQLLIEMPHREFLDLSIIYSVDIPYKKDDIGSVRIDRNHLAYWDVTEEELYQQAMENMKKDGNGFRSLLDVLGETMDMETGLWEDDNPLYIVSNKTGVYGAVQILNKDLMKQAAETFQRDFFILPSSVHECLLFPESEQVSADSLKGMVQDANDTIVAVSERLSYSVYRYDCKTGEIQIAA